MNRLETVNRTSEVAFRASMGDFSCQESPSPEGAWALPSVIPLTQRERAAAAYVPWRARGVVGRSNLFETQACATNGPKYFWACALCGFIDSSTRGGKEQKNDANELKPFLSRLKPRPEELLGEPVGEGCNGEERWPSAGRTARLDAGTRTLACLLSCGALVLCVTGCFSVQVPNSHSGLPRILGFGSVSEVSARQGMLYRMSSPGLSLRFHSFAPGLTLGWHQTTLFLPATNDAPGSISAHPIAVLSKNYGIGVVPFGVVAGANSQFAIACPETSSSFVQVVQFFADSVTNSLIKKEIVP
jgi:hypothetical protein